MSLEALSWIVPLQEVFSVAKKSWSDYVVKVDFRYFQMGPDLDLVS